MSGAVHSHVRFRNDDGPWSPCPVGCPAAEPTEELRRALLDLADNLDYYASKTTGGTHASGLSDAATQLRDALGAPHAEEEL